MAENERRVIYFERVQAPLFLEMLEAEPGVNVERLANSTPPATAFETLARTHVYQITSAKDELPAAFRAEAPLFEQCPGILAVSTHGAGYDTVDLDACTAAGVIAVNQAGGNREGVAEHALAMMLNLLKRITETDRVMRREAGIERARYIGNDLAGKTVGIIGLGNVGSRLAEILRVAFSCRVIACDPYVDEAACRLRGAERTDLDTLLGEADVLSINCPLTRETHGMIGERELARMKEESWLVTTARGGVVREDALYQALKAGKLRGAGLDVFDVEPPPVDHPLLALDNVVVSPHTAGVTVESRREIARIAAEQLLGIFRGERPPRLLNPEAWPAYAERFERTFGFRPG